MTEPDQRTDPVLVPSAPGRFRLLVVLVALAAITPLARTVFALWTAPGAPRPRPDIWADVVFYGRYGVAYLCGGLLIDRFGLRRVVGLALIGWCGLVLLGGSLTDPASLAAVHVPVVFAYGIFEVAPLVAVKRGVRSGATAPVLMMAMLASFMLVPAGEVLRDLIAATAPPGDLSLDRMWLALVCATFGAFLTLIWLVLYRDPGVAGRNGQRDAIVRLRAFLVDRRVWRILVPSASGAVLLAIGEHRLFRFLETERQVSAGTVGLAMAYPYVAAILGALAAAVWSDRILRDGGSLVAARRPFVVAGFALCAALGLVPFVRQGDLLVMTSIAALGIGIQMLIAVVVLDIAPPAGVGTLVGLALAVGSLVRFGFVQLAIPLYRQTHSFVPILVFGGLVGLGGAVAAYRLLRRIEPIEGPAPADIPALFT